MNKEKLKNLIDVAAGRKPADIVITGAKIIDVFSGNVITGDIAVADGYIAGIGEYSGEKTIDARGYYVSPGFIDSHIHIESSYMTPEEFGRLSVPCGTTTIIADPHEIVNVCGVEGLKYMCEAAENTALDIRYMVPSCVPSTPFENAGAVLNAEDIKKIFEDFGDGVLGLAEFMNAVGVVNNDDECINKIMAAREDRRVIDGHSPGLVGKGLNAYMAAGIKTDHECSTIQEMKQRISGGMYVLLRQGSACQDLERLASGVDESNYRRVLLCSDDRQVHTIFTEGHIDGLLRICVKKGIEPVNAIRMATLNAAECFNLDDVGSISPGKRANLVFFNNLRDFNVSSVMIDGRMVAKNHKYLEEVKRVDPSAVASSVHVKDFSADRFKLKLKSNKVKVIDVMIGGVLTGKDINKIELTKDGDFKYNKKVDIVKLAVVERHKGLGNVGVALLGGYGIKDGACAISVAHDSHNIIVAGTDDKYMETAVNEIIRMKGGMTLVHKGEVISSIPLPIAGLMTDMDAESFDRLLGEAHILAHKKLKIHDSVEPFMTLCFMSLPVIPKLKLTDMGLFDVETFSFTSIESGSEEEEA
ncbi:MAG: adenine deaminase [Lachnospiraceae bacterium]|nr:adenine deaminase [Lachnospiraceae bacterium]